MSWQGRQLASATGDGKSLSFTYDSEGIRTSKTVDGVKTEYLLNGTQILAQKTGSNTLCFFYDQQGNRVGMADSGNHFYYYLYNLQGDVIALADASTGKLVATYTYDAWGKCVNVRNADGYTIGTDNPFRYRGYYYDNDTGLYYLQSRYYDPTIGRFINADVYVTTNVTGLINSNMFAYCENNPVNMVDNSGTDAISLVVGGYISASSSLGCANIWNPIGWAVLGVTAIVAGIVLINNIIEVTAEETGQFQTYDPDPYKRPGQKKQGRENKEKKKRSGSWEGNKNKRQKPLPKHTPGREHRKYKTQKTKFVIVEIIHQIMVD